jgi:hypothetical protein
MSCGALAYRSVNTLNAFKLPIRLVRMAAVP